MDRDIRSIERDMLTIKNDIKKYAKKNDKKSINTLAKSLIRSKRTIQRLYETKAQVNSAIMQIKEQEATFKVVGAMRVSGKLMETMGHLVKIPQIAQISRQMAKEMARTGLINEVVDDALESLDDDDTEELAEREVSKVLFEITGGQFGQIDDIKNELPKEEVEEDESMEPLARRLADIKS